jgi:hypothetical protein
MKKMRLVLLLVGLAFSFGLLELLYLVLRLRGPGGSPWQLSRLPGRAVG